MDIYLKMGDKDDLKRKILNINRNIYNNAIKTVNKHNKDDYYKKLIKQFR